MKKYSFIEELYDPVSSNMALSHTRQMSRRGAEDGKKTGRTWIGTPLAGIGGLGGAVLGGIGGLVVGGPAGAGIGAIAGGAAGANLGRKTGAAAGKVIGGTTGAATGLVTSPFKTKGQKLSAETYENERTLANPNATWHQKHVAQARLQRARQAQQNLANYYDAISKTPDPEQRKEIARQFKARSRHLNDIYSAHKQMG